MDGQKGTNNIQDSTFNIAASWQANKNILLKVSYLDYVAVLCMLTVLML